MQIRGITCQKVNIGTVPKQAHHAIQPLEKTEKSAQLHLEMQKLRLERLCLAFLQLDRKSTRLNSSHIQKSRMPSSA